MAVRTPVYWDGSSIAEMSASQITAIKQKCVYLFGGASRSVNLSYDVGNSGGGIRRMLDTSDTPSAESLGGGAFPTPGVTVDGGTSTTYDYIAETIGTPSDPTDTNNTLYPIFVDADGVLQAMSKTDMYDTFINDAIDLLVDGNDRDGTYRLSTQPTTLANHTLVNANPIFTDTRFDKTLHGSATVTTTDEFLPLPEVITTEIENWYLWRTNQGTSYGVPSVQLPLYINSNNELQEYSEAQLDTILENDLFYSAALRSPYRIQYDVEGSGVDAGSITDNVSTPQTRGDAVTDTTLDSSVIIQDNDGADIYRSQRLPTGSPEIETTYTLKIYRN